MLTSLVFPSWWQALAAVPPSKTARDWWAPDDLRHPRYERLYRVWGDPTDGVPPPYYKAEKEKHLVPTLWENFALFSPADTIKLLFRELKFELAEPAVDLCWSYEFNLGHQDRQLDVVLHVRFPDRDEVVIGEAKAGCKRFAEKDVTPRDVLSRDVFRFAGHRRYFLLGDATPPDGWATCGYGRLTWPQLLKLQSDLCEVLSEPPVVRQFVRLLIQSQFAGHDISDVQPSVLPGIAEVERMAGSLLKDASSEQCRQFITCALQHLRCLARLPGNGVPIPYLVEEPTVEHIKRHWRLGCGKRVVNEKAYWRLPTR